MFIKFWNRIRFYFTLRSINAQLKELKELRAKLIHRPRLEDIPDNLERIERITSRKKALKKKRQKLLKKSLEFSL
jgi:predicted nucleic acid-binding protein